MTGQCESRPSGPGRCCAADGRLVGDRLRGQVSIVTGGGRGIGRAVAMALAAEGMGVALVARTANQVHDTAAEVEAYGVPVLPVVGDVSDPGVVTRLLAHAEQRLGPIDLLVNNAGGTEARQGPLWEADLEETWAVVETNLRGPMQLAAAALPAMIGRRRGRIVNVNSLAGTRPSSTETGYSVSKAALSRLTDCLSTALRGTGVAVFDISPGLVRTEMTRGLVRLGDVAPHEWTPAERTGEVVVDIAAGRFDALAGRFLHVAEDLDALLANADRIADADARVLRLAPYGADDPLFAD